MRDRDGEIIERPPGGCGRCTDGWLSVPDASFVIGCITCRPWLADTTSNVREMSERRAAS